MTKEAFNILRAFLRLDKCDCGRYHVEVPQEFMDDVSSVLAKSIDKCHDEANMLNDRFAEDHKMYNECLEIIDRLGPVQTLHWKIQTKDDSERLAERQRRLEIILVACDFKQRSVN